MSKLPDKISYGLYGEADIPVKFGIKNGEPFCYEIKDGKLIESEKIFEADAAQDAFLISKEEFEKRLIQSGYFLLGRVFLIMMVVVVSSLFFLRIVSIFQDL